MLQNLAFVSLSKNRKPALDQLMIFNVFLLKVVEVCPACDPSWGVLRKAASAFLETMQSQKRDEGFEQARKWDERLLADQLATSLFWARKALRDPVSFNHMLNDLKQIPESKVEPWEEQWEQMLEAFDAGEDPSEVPESNFVVDYQSKPEKAALMAIEDEAPPDMKIRYHQKLKRQKEAKEKVQELDAQIAEYEAFLETGKWPEKEFKTPQRARVKRQEGSQRKERQKPEPRRYLPHKTLGELQLTCAKGKSYICLRSSKHSSKARFGKPTYTFWLGVYGSGKFGSEDHKKICTEVFDKTCASNLTLEEAKALRGQLLEQAHA